MKAIEMNMVVKDSLEALALYEKIFDVKRIEVNDFVKGQNEVVFSIYEMRIHMLDENPEFQMYAPDKEKSLPIWFNVIVPDIAETYQKAIDAGCTSIQPVTEMPEMGIAMAMVLDPFGYAWMIHQIKKEISREERLEILEKEFDRKE
ncbi:MULTISPECIES: VOC family protein [unclassified Enterococcus]|uniref:VOC family protein n=1 Tax=unclassified Enterococcus TaxID=2608891 RepID=UPI003D2A9716